MPVEELLPAHPSVHHLCHHHLPAEGACNLRMQPHHDLLACVCSVYGSDDAEQTSAGIVLLNSDE